MDKIPLVDLQAQYRSIKKEIDAAIQHILDTNQFIGGAPLADFERNFAKFCGKPYAVGTSSGTSALYTVLKALDIREGDEVITVPNTFIATSEVVNECGAAVKFVDVEEGSFLMDPELLKKAITPKTKAVIPVHLYGQSCDMKAISEICGDKVAIIEDAAQAHGAKHHGKRVPFTDIGCFSFYPGKNLGAYGDAGAIVCEDETFALKCAQFANHGRKAGEKYLHHELGSNYRMDTLQAAVLDVKLKHLDAWTQARRKVASWYNELLDGKIITPVEKKGNEHVYHLYVIQSRDRQGLLEHLHKQGIQAGVHYPVPLHLQPSYAYLGLKRGSFPVGEKLCESCVSLPLYPELSKEQVRFVAEQVMAFESARP